VRQRQSFERMPVHNTLSHRVKTKVPGRTAGRAGYPGAVVDRGTPKAHAGACRARVTPASSPGIFIQWVQNLGTPRYLITIRIRVNITVAVACGGLLDRRVIHQKTADIIFGGPRTSTYDFPRYYL
jgi:hypothetical protein